MRTPFSSDMVRFIIVTLAAMLPGGCGSTYPRAPALAASSDYRYVIGPGDTVTIHVFRNPDLSMTVPVRPDGKIAAPLVEDLPAIGKVPGCHGAVLFEVARSRVIGFERLQIVALADGGIDGKRTEQQGCDQIDL